MPSARQGQITSVISWILLILSTLAISARLITKFKVSRGLNVDDALATVSLVLSIGSGAALSVLDINGLGNHLEDFTESQLETFSKANYAVELLFIATLCFAKLSIVVFMHLLTPSRLHRQLVLAVGVFIFLVGFISEITAAFQCGAPEPWNFAREDCFDRVAFWQFFGTINIISDVCLIVLPLYILLGLQLNLSKKIVMLSCFGARVIDIIATGIQLAFVSTINSVDPTRDISTWLLMTQVIQCITIVTSCIPYLRPLLQSYPSGLFLSDEIRRKQSRITYSTNGGSRDITALRGTGKKSTRLTSQKLPSATLSEQLKDDRASYHSEQYMLGRSGSIGASTPTDGDLSTAEAK